MSKGRLRLCMDRWNGPITSSMVIYFPFQYNLLTTTWTKFFTMPIKLWPQVLQQIPTVPMTKDQSLCMVHLSPAWFIYTCFMPLSVLLFALQEGWPLPGLFFIIIFLTVGGRPGGWQKSISFYPFLPLAASASPPDTTEQIWLRSSSLTFSSSLTTGCLHLTCSLSPELSSDYLSLIISRPLIPIR